jgi:hypothetical protein
VSRRSQEARERMGREMMLARRAGMFRHVGWQSEYAPDPRCPHLAAREVENDEPLAVPDPLPESWFPMRLRHWVCAGCGAAVCPHAFLEAEMTPLPADVRAAWWDRWRAYERSVNGVAA